MNLLQNILSILTSILILLPTLGININTHICGQTEDVSKSLIIPGILSPKECDKCHKVVVLKSCCSNKDFEVEETTGDDKNDKGCCQDILEYNDFDYLTIAPYVQNIDFSSVSFIVSETYSFLNTQDLTHKTKILDTRRRPYIVDIQSFNCTYLI